MSTGPNHHYIPIFYLQQWAGSDGRLVEYCQRHRGRGVVVPRPTFPAGTGYAPGLYLLPDAPAEQAEIIETKLMKGVDNWASKALVRMLEDGESAGRLEEREALGWCQFLYSLIVRNPEHLELVRQKLSELGPEALEGLREQYDTIRTPADPATFEEYKANFAVKPVIVSPARVLPTLLNSKRVVKVIASMKWFTHTVRTAWHTFLTSDRPVIVSNGLIRPKSHILIPMCPRKLFVAVKEQRTLDDIKSIPPDTLVEAVNNQLSQQAYKFVYGYDASQLRFVSNRLGKRVWSSPLG